MNVRLAASRLQGKKGAALRANALYNHGNGMIRTPSAATVRARAAIAGGQPEALRLILGHIAHPLPGGVRALRGAAAQGSTAMAGLLLAHGADATRIGVGRWVLHPELAPLLASRGAAIDSSGSWIGAACTGNQGRKDDPDYVRALRRPRDRSPRR